MLRCSASIFSKKPFVFQLTGKKVESDRDQTKTPVETKNEDFPKFGTLAWNFQKDGDSALLSLSALRIRSIAEEVSQKKNA